MAEEKSRALEAHPLLAWGLWTLMAGAPLLWSNAFIARFTLPKFLALSLGVLLSALGLALSKGTPLPSLSSPLASSLIASAAALGLSAFFSLNRPLSLAGRYDSYAYGLWPLALYASAFLLSASLSERRRRQTLRLCLSVGGLIGLYAGLQGLGFEILTGVGTLPQGRRAVSTLGSPVDLGAYLAALLPLALHWALKSEERALGWVLLLSITAGLLATLSRGALLGGAAGCALYLALGSGWGKFRARLKWLLPVMAAAALLAFAGLRLSSRSVKAADAARPEIWNAAWRVFLDHPWLGTGPDTFEADFRRYRSEAFIRVMGTQRLQAYAHNDFLQALATTGLAGTFAYAALLAALCLAAKRALDDPAGRQAAAAVCGGLAALFVVMKFDPVSLEVLVTASVLSGLLCALPSARERPPGLRWTVIACGLLFSALSTACAMRLARADIAVKSASRLYAESPEKASLLMLKGIRMNPCELSYHVLFVNRLSERVNAAPTFALRRELLAQAEALKSEACRPNDVNAHYIQGILSLMQAQVGMKDRLPSAAQALDRAISLDPDFLPLLRSRLNVAAMMKDQSKAAAITKRIESLSALHKD